MGYKWVLFSFLVLLAATSANAQIANLVSPGELSRAHEKFTGLKNCNVCHGGDQAVLDAKCLDCHKTLAARIREGKGDKTALIANGHRHSYRDLDVNAASMARLLRESGVARGDRVGGPGLDVSLQRNCRMGGTCREGQGAYRNEEITCSGNWDLHHLRERPN